VFHYMHDSRYYKVMGSPAVISLPAAKVRAFPIIELREVLRKHVNPFLKGGWRPDEKDTDLYLLEVLDSRGAKPCGEIDLTKDGVVNLVEMAENKEFALGLFFKTEGIGRDRYVEDQKGVSRMPTSGSSKGLNVAACIDALTSQEVLPQSEAWFCPRCKGHKMASKKFDLWMLPDILIIHLKRFSYNKYWRDKIDAYIDFPLENLDMAPWVTNPEEKKNCLYNLYAVSNHFGSLGGGHYTACAKNLLNQRWYNLDDSSVSPVDGESAKSKAAYVLFYHRSVKRNVTYDPSNFQ